MKTTTTLNDVRYAASICLKCGSCTYGDWPENHRLCALYYRDPCFTHGGGGFMSIVTALAENLLPYDRKIAELAYTCSGCLACDSRCSIIKAHPPQVDITDMIRLLRFEAVKKGFVPRGAKRIQSTAKKGVAAGREGSLKLPKRIRSDKADSVIFLESASTGSQKDISAAFAVVLDKIGTPVMAFGETPCCGCTLYDYGFWNELLPLMEANWERMKGLVGKTFIFTNPHCEEFTAKRYPENISDCHGIGHQHVSQLLASAFKDGRLAGKKKDKIRVSYHDPCTLGRGLGVYDAPREVLVSMGGVELVEMPRNRKSAYCCGAKVLGNYFSGHSGEMARERIGEFEATGADLLITACPYCRENFRKVLPDDRKGQVKDLVEFVAERV
ncbi:MAG: (Fe-S)-binding protein [Desulfobacteraceae bacterium]|nr:MAG: (Fe-S)-binding protein [Desulfobacteraceae bacterium]